MNRAACTLIAIALAAVMAPSLSAQQRPTTAYVRYIHTGHPDVASYGILEGDTIQELKGSLFANPAPTGRTVKRAEVQLRSTFRAQAHIAGSRLGRTTSGPWRISSHLMAFMGMPGPAQGEE